MGQYWDQGVVLFPTFPRLFKLSLQLEASPHGLYPKIGLGCPVLFDPLAF